MAKTNICHLEADVVKRTSSGARLLFSFKGFRLIWPGMACALVSGVAVCLWQSVRLSGLSQPGTRRCVMYKWKLVTVSAVLSMPLIISGVSVAQQVVCNPLCTPGYNKPRIDGNHRGQGLTNANEVAGEHGFNGRDNARLKQDAHRPGGSGVSDPAPPPPPPPTPPSPSLDPVNTNPLIVAPTCSLC